MHELPQDEPAPSEHPELSANAGQRSPSARPDAPAARYGASWGTLRQATGVLRARAARHGVVVAERPSAEQEAAAAIAVELWMTALGADSLENPRRYGAPALRALAAALALLANETPETGAAESWGNPGVPGLAERLLAAAESAAVAAEGWGVDAVTALNAAAAALAAGGANKRLASASAALRVTAESRTYPTST